MNDVGRVRQIELMPRLTIFHTKTLMRLASNGLLTLVQVILKYDLVQAI